MKETARRITLDHGSLSGDVAMSETVGWVEHGNLGLRCVARTGPEQRHAFARVSTPCVTHHFPGGSLHTPYALETLP